MRTRTAAALLATLLLCLSPSISGAQNWQGADLTIFEILGDPEALSLGGATSLRGTGARATTGNPAGLLEVPRNEAVVDLSEGPDVPWSFGLPLDIRMEGGHGMPQAIGYAHSFGRYAVGLGFERTYRGQFKVGGDFAEEVRYRKETYQLTGAWRASDNVYLGLGARLVNGTGSEVYTNFPFGPAPNREDSQTGFGASLGAKIFFHRLHLAFLAEGGTNLQSEVAVPDAFGGAFPETLVAHEPLSARLGAEFALHPLIQVLAEGAYFNRDHYESGYFVRDTRGQNVPQNPFRSTFDGSVGVEFKPQSTSPFRVRSGLLRRTDPWKEGQNLLDYGQTFLTFGVGFKVSRFRVDLAVASSKPFEDPQKYGIEQTHWSGGAVFSF